MFPTPPILMPKNLMERVKNIMPYIHEPITHDYLDRGIDKLNKIKFINFTSKNLYLTDASRKKNISRLYILNYSSKSEIMKISPNFIKFKKVIEENLNNKVLKNVKHSKGIFEIIFKPNEWKVIRIE